MEALKYNATLQYLNLQATATFTKVGVKGTQQKQSGQADESRRVNTHRSFAYIGLMKTNELCGEKTQLQLLLCMMWDPLHNDHLVLHLRCLMAHTALCHQSSDNTLCNLLGTHLLQQCGIFSVRLVHVHFFFLA
jgi:hypothetical protein